MLAIAEGLGPMGGEAKILTFSRWCPGPGWRRDGSGWGMCSRGFGFCHVLSFKVDVDSWRYADAAHPWWSSRSVLSRGQRRRSPLWYAV